MKSFVASRQIKLFSTIDEKGKSPHLNMNWNPAGEQNSQRLFSIFLLEIENVKGSIFLEISFYIFLKAEYALYIHSKHNE